jgi:ElaB/YqjD/DUF883 family membrane-anchored ribosome-binding protein
VGQRADELEQDRDLAESTVAAREDIELTRAEMTSTIDAIQDKLDPEVLSEQAKDTAHDVTDHAIREAKEAAREITDHAIAQARQAVVDITEQAGAALREATIGKVETMAHTATETAGGWRQTLVETVKANPLPAAVVGLGLGWMFLNRSGQSHTASYGSSARPGRYVRSAYGSGVYGGGGFEPVSSESTDVGGLAEDRQQTLSRAAENAQQTASQVAGQVQGTAEHMLDQVQETGGQVVDQVQAQASRAQSFLQHQLEENPLLVGAVALALGGVLASTVPVTPREDQLMGEARDRVLGTARELTHDTMDKVGRVVDEVQSAAQTEARNQSLVP